MKRKGITSRLSGQSITFRVRIGLLLLVLGSVLITGSAQIYFSLQTQVRQLASLQRQRSQAVAAEINGFINDLQDTMSYLARTRGLTELPKQAQRNLLEAMSRHNNAYELVAILDSSGKVTASYSPYNSGYRSEFSDTPLFHHVYTKKEDYFSPVYVDPDTHLLVATLGVPIRDNRDEVAGILMTVVNLRFLWFAVSKADIGNTGYLYMIDNRDRVIAQSGNSSGDFRIEDISGKTYLSALKENKIDLVTPYRGLRGIKVIGSISLVRMAYWHVVLELPVKEAFAPITSLLRIMVLILAVALTVVIIISFGFIRSVVEPLGRLTVAASKISGGDLNVCVEIEREDEIGVLGVTFNLMAAKIRKLVENLEQRMLEISNAHEALRESEEKYRRIVNTAYEGVWGVDSNRCTNFVNRRLCEMLEYGPEEMNGRNVNFFVFDEDMADHTKRMESRRNGLAEQYERRWRRKDGSAVWTIVSAVPVFNAGNNFVGAFAMLTDISDRKRAEAIQYRLNRELSAISDCNQVLVRTEEEQELLDKICAIICEKAGYCLAWVGFPENDDTRTVRPVAWAGDERGYLASANISWDDNERGRGPTGRAIRTGISQCIQDFETDPLALPWREHALLRGYRSNIALPLKDEKEAVFGALMIYSTEPNAFTPEEIRLLGELADDLAFGIGTLRVRIEHRKAEMALQESEASLRGVLMNSPDTVYTLDLLSHKISFLNRESFCGYMREEMESPDSLISAVYPDDLGFVRRNWMEVLAGRSITSLEYRLRNKNGGMEWIEQRVSVLDRNLDGSIRKLIVTLSLITERKLAEEEIKNLNLHLEARVEEKSREIREKDLLLFQQARMAAMGEMLSSIAHHWRQPLNALSITIQSIEFLYKAGQLTQEKLSSMIDQSKEIASAMSRTIDTFRSFVSPRKNNNCFQISDCLDNVIKLADSYLSEDRVRLSVENRIRDRLVIGREDELVQVLLALFSNSRDIFEDRKSTDPEIRIQIDDLGEGLIIVFSDNAGGIPEEFLPKIFEPYFSTKPILQGMGLGLYIARMVLMKEFNGTITASNGPTGAEFRIIIPNLRGCR